MQASIRIRRAWNVQLVTVPIEELAIIALQAVPGIRSPVVEREDMHDVVLTFQWDGQGTPDVPADYLHRFGLEIAPELGTPSDQEKGGGPI
ncbi:hypothetical protein [Lysobacter enzymogenes]|uniref:hypothetical protein n=1 Tax=Lysobacter enzymogenes TaxID=69 RepID=UPI001AF0F62D|nr:hypothetical protein [Lysobacter enzymogenes]QQQ00918.1 hypothetical protein JHW41_23100 [Lysobacter enzymogenes]